MKTIIAKTNREFNAAYIEARAFSRIMHSLSFDSVKKVYFFVTSENRYEITEENFTLGTIY